MASEEGLSSKNEGSYIRKIVMRALKLEGRDESELFKKLDRESALFLLKNELISEHYLIKSMITRKVKEVCRSDLIKLVDSKSPLDDILENRVDLTSALGVTHTINKYLKKLNNQYKIVEKKYFKDIALVPDIVIDDEAIAGNEGSIAVSINEKYKEKIIDLDEEESEDENVTYRTPAKEDAYKELKESFYISKKRTKEIFSRKRKSKKSSLLKLLDSVEPTNFQMEDIKKAYDDLTEISDYIYTIKAFSNFEEFWKKYILKISSDGKICPEERPLQIDNSMYQ